MRLQSLLFVPGDRPERFDKAAASGADALILDLEDSVAEETKDAARAAVVRRLGVPRRDVLHFVRINPLGTQSAGEDLAALRGIAPDAVVLPKAEGAESVELLAARLRQAQIDAPILPIATETPAAIFQLGSYARVCRHLAGLTWGAEDLPAAIGAASSREEDGCYTLPYEMVRSLTLFAAHAAGVAAIETVYPALWDSMGSMPMPGARHVTGSAAWWRFIPGRSQPSMPLSPPDAEQVAHALRIVAAFAAAPGTGALQVDGRMVDAPHLKQAKRTLDRAGEAE